MISKPASTLAISGALALLLTASTPVPAGKPQPVYPYKFTDLGGPGYEWLPEDSTYDVNEPDADGVIQIVGSDASHGSAMWEATTDGVVLSRTSMPQGQHALAVNDAGWVVLNDRGSLYVDVPGVGRVDLLSPHSGYATAAINNSGQVVVKWGDSLSGMWSIAPDGTVSDFVDLGWLVILDINDWGEMVGYEWTTSPDQPIVAWFENGELHIDVLFGYYGYATSINNFGEIVGRLYDGGYHPWLWSPTRGLTVLPGNGVPKDINDRGQIVGHYYRKNDGRQACLWENGQLFDLEDLSGVGTKNFALVVADSINEAGDIVGLTARRDGGGWDWSSFLLTPNP